MPRRTHLLEYSLVIASVVSIGHLSTTALAAATLGSMTASVSGFSIIQGFASTLDTMLPSAWTSSHPELVGYVCRLCLKLDLSLLYSISTSLWSQRMAVVMAATLVPIYVVWFNSESILLLLGQEAEVAHLASVYLKWVSIGLPAYTFNSISRCVRPAPSKTLFFLPICPVVISSPKVRRTNDVLYHCAIPHMLRLQVYSPRRLG